MTALTEGLHAAEFVISEASGTRSRQAGTLLSGNDLDSGTVLGKVTKGTASAEAGGSNTGDGAMGAITVGALAVAGIYTLNIIEAATNAGRFELLNPDGVAVGEGNVASAFSGGGLSFTLADGATDFVVGDTFAITVAAGSGKYDALDLTGADGSEDAVAILWGPVDASLADASCAVITRDCEVNGSLLTWPAGITADQKAAYIAALEGRGIIVR